MKIKFSNLGTIKETELDLRPLTVIIGPNNSNKTYIAYSVYGLWLYARQNIRLDSAHEFDQLGFIEKEKGTWSLTIDDKLFDLFIRDIEELSKRFKGKTLESFFQDSSRKLFSESLFKMKIERQELEDAFNRFTQSITYFSLGGIDIKMTREDNILSFQFKKDDEPISDDETISQEKEGITYKPYIFFFKCLEQIFFSKIFPFPAERTAFINIYKILENRRYNLLKETQRNLFVYESKTDFIREYENIRYPKPIEDFLTLLTNIEIQESTLINSNSNEFEKLADKIEKNIQNSNKVKLKPTRLSGKEIKVELNENLEIDIYNASSSIKQLAPLLLYLRFRASKGDFLVIDEPEMNLHPESQAKLLEALSILVNLGVRVLLTTHSPYIMSHLNNLVNGNHENPEILERQSLSLYLKDKRAFLPIDQVSAYEMKDNKLVSLNDPDYGIRWDTLSDVSVDIQQKYFEIYEAGQEQTEEIEEIDK